MISVSIVHFSQSNFVSLQYLIQDELDIKTYLDLSFFKSKKLTSLLAFFQSFKIIFISSATTVDELLTLTAGLIKVVSRKVSSAVSCLRWKGTYTLEKKQQRVFSLFSAQSQKWRQMLINVSPASRPIPFRVPLSGFEPQLLFSSQMLSQLSYNFEDTDRLRQIYCSSQLGIEYSSLIF